MALKSGPVDGKLALHRLDTAHSLVAVDHLGGRDQHLLRVAAAQRAGAAKRAMVSNRDRPAGLATAKGGDAGGSAGANYDQVIRFIGHLFSPHLRCPQISPKLFHPAQQESSLTSLVNVCAVSFNPSTIVRYGNS